MTKTLKRATQRLSDMKPILFYKWNTNYSDFLFLWQFAAVLDGVLAKLSRYDEGTFFSSILSFTVSSLVFLLLTGEGWDSPFTDDKSNVAFCWNQICIVELLLASSVFFSPHSKVKAAAKYVDVPVSMSAFFHFWKKHTYKNTNKSWACLYSSNLFICRRVAVNLGRCCLARYRMSMLNVGERLKKYPIWIQSYPGIKCSVSRTQRPITWTCFQIHRGVGRQ